MEEELRNTVEATDQNAQYDACAKRILGNKQILAHIIKAAIPGFQDMKPSEIIPYIEGEPLIGNVRIEPGLTNPSMSEVISGMNTEDTDRSEGKIYFDVLFYLLEETGLSKVIINVEAQRKEDAGYPIINRGIYYGCRNISSQKGREFVHSNYGDIKKVYSIWVCFNLDQDCMNILHMENTAVIGNHEWKGDPQLMNVILIGLRKETADTEYTSTGNALHDLLKIVFSNYLTSEERIDLLEKREDFSTDTNLRKELDHMCNLSYGISEIAMEKGWTKGMEKGMELGRIQSIQKLLSKKIAKEDVKNMLDATDEEIATAEEMLHVK